MRGINQIDILYRGGLTVSCLWLVNCIFVNIPKHISCQVFVQRNVSHWFLNTFQFVLNNPFLPGVILLMGPLSGQISEPSLIQYEYLRLQLSINNAGQGRGDRQAKDKLPVILFYQWNQNQIFTIIIQPSTKQSIE